VAVFNEQLAGEVVRWQTSVQEPPLERRYWMFSDVRPLPASDAVPARVLLPVSGVPGSVSDVAGAVLSIRRELTLSVRE
jgi:hypothetical protein